MCANSWASCISLGVSLAQHLSRKIVTCWAVVVRAYASGQDSSVHSCPWKDCASAVGRNSIPLFTFAATAARGYSGAGGEPQQRTPGPLRHSSPKSFSAGPYSLPVRGFGGLVISFAVSFVQSLGMASSLWLPLDDPPPTGRSRIRCAALLLSLAMACSPDCMRGSGHFQVSS